MKALRERFSRLHPDHQRIASGAFRVAIFLVLGKAAGAFKEMAVAYRYGVSDAVDAYQFTLTMATWLPVTAVSVLSVALPLIAAFYGGCTLWSGWQFHRGRGGLWKRRAQAARAQ